MDEYELLLKELETLLKAKQIIQCKELLAWSRERNIGPVTLLSLVEDLVHKGVAEASSEQELIDDFLELSLPKRLSLKRAQTPSSPHTPRVAHPKRRRRTGREPRKGELLKFLYAEEAKEEPDSEVRIEETPREELDVPTSHAPLLKPDESPTGGEAFEERDYVAALQYLYKFWSVGELRFEADMKSLGVRDASTLLRRLQEEGLVEVIEPGVINAKRELIERRLKEVSSSLPSSSLADLFG